MTRNPRGSSRRRHLATLAALALAPLAAPAAAQDRPLRLILPVAAASGVDTITRAAQQALSKALGQPVVIENQPGAGGILGTHAMVKSPADGFTMGMVSNNHVIYPSVYKSVPFHPVEDITPVAVIGSTPMVLVVNPKVPANNAKELIALLKSKPGEFNYASSGNGTILHLATELFLDAAGVRARHIPYKGVGPMLSDLIGGQVHFAVSSLPSVQQHLKSGALRAIGVASPQRVSAAPEIATLDEQGLPNFHVEGWFALVGPKGLPAAEVRRLHAAVSAAFAAPEVREAMAKQGNTINISTPEAAQQHFRSELARYAKIIKTIGLEPQ